MTDERIRDDIASLREYLGARTEAIYLEIERLERDIHDEHDRVILWVAGIVTVGVAAAVALVKLL